VYQHVVKAYPAHAAGQIIKYQNDIEDLKAQLADALQATHNLSNAHALELEKSVQQTQAVQAQVLQLQAELQNTQATLAWTETQLQNHRQSLNEVLNSASWKITKPFRALGGK
jgi:hypothetical protein